MEGVIKPMVTHTDFEKLVEKIRREKAESEDRVRLEKLEKSEKLKARKTEADLFLSILSVYLLLRMELGMPHRPITVEEFEVAESGFKKKFKELDHSSTPFFAFWKTDISSLSRQAASGRKFFAENGFFPANFIFNHLNHAHPLYCQGVYKYFDKYDDGADIIFLIVEHCLNKNIDHYRAMIDYKCDLTYGMLTPPNFKELYNDLIKKRVPSKYQTVIS